MGRTRLVLSNAWLLAVPATASAEAPTLVRDGGVFAIWILANLAHAGMRAQGSKKTGWRILAFIDEAERQVVGRTRKASNGCRPAGRRLS
jgi:hypothetical protein